MKKQTAFLEKLRHSIASRNSLVCVGLDFDPLKTPEKFKNDPLGYNRLVIDATKDLVCAYKPNAAFYEPMGTAGLEALRKTIQYVPEDIPVILDAKRGDIGNTSRQYAIAAFELLDADAITVSPYMGEDSVLPFLEFRNKGVFVLCLTSNKGASDFQRLKADNTPLYIHVARKCCEWAAKYNPNTGLVVGATQDELREIRDICPLPFLIPGVGAQGGDLEKAVRLGNKGGLAVINSSRGIIYPQGENTTAESIRFEAERLKSEINRLRT